MIGTILAAARLCGAIVGVYPDVPLDRACSAAWSITLAAPDADRPLVAALAHRESRFLPTAGNRCCAGPMAVRGFDVRRGELAGYVAGVAMLGEARRWCARRGTPGDRCALAVFVSGPRGARGRLWRGPRRALADRDRLRAVYGGRPGARREGASS